MALNSKYIDDYIREFKDPDRSFESYDVINNPYDNVQIGLRVLKSRFLIFSSWYKGIEAYNAGCFAIKNNEIPLTTLEYVNIICPIEGWWNNPKGIKLIYTYKV